jgi:hypothetical protein
VNKSGVKGRPRWRPFAKRQSDPDGKPFKPRTIRQRDVKDDARVLARDCGAEAIDKLVALMRGVVRVEIDRKRVEVLVPPMTQLAAANALLDRGYGRPHRSVEMTGKEADPIEHHEGSALEVIQSRLAAIRERLLEEGHPLLVQP